MFDRINQEIKRAMLAREKVRLEALRGIKKEFIEAKTEPGANGELTDEQALKILSKMAKQRRETAQIYTEQSRPELAANEIAEAEVIEEFLPKPLTPQEIEAEVKAVIAETGATSMKEMGRVMGIATKKMAGRADGKAIGDVVKRLLA